MSKDVSDLSKELAWMKSENKQLSALDRWHSVSKTDVNLSCYQSRAYDYESEIDEDQSFKNKIDGNKYLK